MAHSGSATKHMLGYIKRIARNEPDVLIIPTGTSDLTNGVNTMKKVRKPVRGIRGIDENEISIGFSSKIGRPNRNLGAEFSERLT